MNTRPLIASRDELISKPEMERPHVVILGAGASVASCPNGDKNGRRLPTMDNVVEVVGLAPLLTKRATPFTDRNFETLYSSLASDLSQSDLIKELESEVRKYFSSLELPDHPTVYDHLLLSLRKKDAVFTFNWDPFLYDAWVRNHQRFELPGIFFLHGNVRASYCLSHPHQWGNPWVHCSECHAQFVPTKILYPVKVKDYAKDSFIASQWTSARWFLAEAFTLTIFGYAAPNSDVEAIDIMNAAWLHEGERLFEHIEIIDIKAQDDLYTTWRPFISHHHYVCRSSFYQSWIANYPRRSSEAVYAPTAQGIVPLPVEIGAAGAEG